MILHRSNRTEELLTALVAVVGESPTDPFARETIVVQGQGMERWISMRLADHLGVWANPDFLSWRGLMERLFAGLLDAGEDVGAAYRPEAMMWSIAEELPRLLSEPAFLPLSHYLADDSGNRKMLQLSERIARCFDEYVIYRPELLLGWEAGRTAGVGPDEAWQSVLWRMLVAKNGPRHLVRRAYEVEQRILDSRGEAGEGWEALPKRISLFGVSTLPPLFLEMLHLVSSRIETHLFLLSPCQEYWADLPSVREKRRALRDFAPDEKSPQHLDGAHPLLASLGVTGRDFQGFLEEVGYLESEVDLYRDPLADGETLLHSLQHDILGLESGEATASDAPRAIDPDDESIRVHSCHSPMREVEVLREELLALFEEMPDLEPRDVIVMTPNVDVYAPFVEAVFGRGGDVERAPDAGDRPLPHRIADRGGGSLYEVVEAFFSALRLLSGRLPTTEVLDLLAAECVRRRFGIEARDLERIEEWVREAGIRWAVDASDRERFDQPAVAQNTWRLGLDRLLLGVAIEDRDELLFGGVRPVGGLEGQSVELLGRFAGFCELLFRERDGFCGLHPVSEWVATCKRLLDGLICHDNDNAQQHRMLHQLLDTILRDVEQASFRDPVDLESMRSLLERRLGQHGRSLFFLSGGITICELVPMRSIPFRVVCLLGMNDQAFPRLTRANGFDLIANRPRRGDRSPREDDRYLFLEALLSARDRILISYVGQSQQEGVELAPSVVVSELLDVLAGRHLGFDTGVAERADSSRRRLVVEHPLQPFSPCNFQPEADSRLRSHSQLYERAARALVETRHPVGPFVPRPLDPPSSDTPDRPPVVEIDELIRFYRSPSQHFLRSRLGIRLSEASEAIPNREPFGLDALERSGIGRELLDRIRQGAKPDALAAALMASGRLPFGLFGRLDLEELVREVTVLQRSAQKYEEDDPGVSIEVDLMVGDVRLVGLLPEVRRSGLVETRFTRVGRGADLSLWIRHLVLNEILRIGTIDSDSLAGRSVLIARADTGRGHEVIEFVEVEDSERILSKLVEFHQFGALAPLPFFIASSRRYVDQWQKNQDPVSALQHARKSWKSGEWNWGDDANPSNVQAFAGVDPFDPEFVSPQGLRFGEVASDVFIPMFEHRRVVE